jgi:large subunit ribosomal protein L21
MFFSPGQQGILAKPGNETGFAYFKLSDKHVPSEERSMYAIVKTGGKQVQVAPGDIITIEKLNAEVGETVSLDEVLLVRNDDQVQVGTPLVAGSSVKAKVLAHDKAKKVIVFKFKKRKDYRRKNGHRQPFTRIKIEEIVTN